MLFYPKLKEISQKVSPEFDQLFNDVINNQSHNGDLLLTLENGFYNPEVYSWTNADQKYSPYMIGPNNEGHSFRTHFKFIHQYRTNVVTDITLNEYLKNITSIRTDIEKYNQNIEIESQNIQLEMLVYLKIWEADSFIKRFYQTCRLLHGEPYDWHFKINESNREKSPTTGKRHELIRNKIRDRLKDKYPQIYKAFKNAYLTQVRNSIAHSKYSMVGRNIHLNNYIENDSSSALKGITFDKWIDMFHYSMIIYDELIRLFKKSSQYIQQIRRRA